LSYHKEDTKNETYKGLGIEVDEQEDNWERFYKLKNAGLNFMTELQGKTNLPTIPEKLENSRALNSEKQTVATKFTASKPEQKTDKVLLGRHWISVDMTKVKKLYINRTLKKMGLGKEQTPKEIGDEEPTWIVYLKPKWYP